ncbi:hypothetical protein D3C85_1078280 [compost metagenome]
MDAQTRLFGRLDQVAQLFLGIDGAVFGRLGQAQRRRRLPVADDRLVQRGAQSQPVDLARIARQADQADALTKEARRACFVSADMGRVVGQHRLIGPRQHGQGDGVGRRAAEDEAHLGVSVQTLTDQVGGPRGRLVRAIGPRKPAVRRSQGVQGVRRHAGGVVRSEIVTHGIQSFSAESRYGIST